MLSPPPRSSAFSAETLQPDVGKVESYAVHEEKDETVRPEAATTAYTIGSSTKTKEVGGGGDNNSIASRTKALSIPTSFQRKNQKRVAAVATEGAAARQQGSSAGGRW